MEKESLNGMCDFEKRVSDMTEYLKAKGRYSHVAGFYMDEPMLWNITNPFLPKKNN